MHEIVTTLNDVVVNLSKVDPTFYVVLVGPLATVVQHFLKKEHDFAKTHGVLTAVLIAAVSGAFLSIMRTSNMQSFLADTALIGSPIYVVANVLFQKVAKKVEELDSVKAAAAPVVPEPAQI